MKKKLFFLWALLLSVIGANAQNWTWSFESHTAGQKYYLYNIGQIRFLNDDNTLTDSPNCIWTVNSDNIVSSNSKYITVTSSRSGLSYSYSAVSNATSKATLTAIENKETYYQIGNKVQTSLTGSQQTRFIISSNSAIAATSTNSVSDDYGKWYLISEAQMDAYNRYQSFIANKASASYANPVDATFLINPGFEGGTFGWVDNGTAKLGTQKNDAESIMRGSLFAEKWAATGSVDFNQTLKAMPAGKYRISTRGVDKAPTKAIFYANSQEVSFGNDVKRMYIDLTLNTEQDIKIGVKHSNHPANTWLGIEEFVVTYYGNDDYSGATEDNPKDVTGWIFNNSFERGNNDGWTHLGVGGAMAIQNNNSFGKDGTYYCESWQPGYNKGVEQTLENLPAGVYKLSLRAKARGVKNAKLYIGDNETAIEVSNEEKEYTVEGTCFENSVKIGFYSEVADGAPVNDSWMAIDNFRLSYYESAEGSDEVKDGVHYYFGAFTTAPAVELTDEVPNADLTGANIKGTIQITATNPNGLVYAKAGQATNLSQNVIVDGTCDNLVLTDGHPFKATKNFKATNASYNMTAIAGDKFGTLMLPFAVNTIPNSGKAYTLDQGVSFGDEIHATEATSITSNKPVLVTAAGTYSAKDVDIAATNDDTYTNGELVGTYKAMGALQNTYVLQKHDSGSGVAFYIVGGTQPTINPFRAYIKAQSAGVKALNILFDDEETGVGSLTMDNGQQTTVYDLSGRKVSKAQKGVYIINGKKVMK